MTSLKGSRRSALVLAGILAWLAGGPTSALGAERTNGVSCVMDDEHVVAVTIGQDATAEIYRTTDGRILVNGSCDSPFGPDPTVWNTKSIQIRGTDGGAGTQHVKLFLYNGGFAPGYGDEAGTTDEIEMTLLLGGATDMDSLHILGGPEYDHFTFAWVPGNWLPIPAINLNATDGDYDLLYLSVEYVSASGEDGGDVISGNDVEHDRQAYLPLYLHGGPGHDQLTGGSANDLLSGGGGADTLKGGQGIDRLYAVDQLAGNDSLYGGSQYDFCVSDAGDFESGCELNAPPIPSPDSPLPRPPGAP